MIYFKHGHGKWHSGFKFRYDHDGLFFIDYAENKKYGFDNITGKLKELPLENKHV